MKNCFSMFRNRSRGGIFYVKNNETGQRGSLFTADKNRASELLMVKNESVRERTHNAQKARIYALASDPKARTRTWSVALKAMIESKKEGSENRARLDRFSKEKSPQPILDLVLLETQAEQVLNVVKDGCVSTNIFLRRLQNFCVGMNWLPMPVLPAKQLPKFKFKKKRAIKHEEHLKIIAREKNPERRDFYNLCWELGGSQSDVANLEAEDIDWPEATICYDREKLASLDETDVKPPIIRFGKRCSAILRRLPQSGPLFPNLRTQCT